MKKTEADGVKLTDEAYRTPLAVSKVMLFPNGESFAVCPRCDITLEREYQAYCDRCGQCLEWRRFRHATLLKF